MAISRDGEKRIEKVINNILTEMNFINTDTVNASLNTKLTKPAQTVTVAQSGGDFSSIQAAINSITDADSSKPYVILIFPGFYTENLVLKDFVHLQGFGSVEYSTSSVVVQGTNNVVTTANCNVYGIRFILQTGGSGTIKCVNGAGTGTTFRCTFLNCYFQVTGNYGANVVKTCENNGTSDIFFINCSVYYRPQSSTGCICFDGVTGTLNAVNLYMNHFLPSGSTNLVFWKKQSSTAIDEIYVVFFRENPTDANVIMFNNTSAADIHALGIFGKQTNFIGTYIVNTSSGITSVGSPDFIPPTPNTQTGSYTSIGSDAQNTILMNVGSGNTVSIPKDSVLNYPIGTEINIIQIGAGQTTIQAVDSGTTTINSTGATSTAPALRTRYSSATAKKIAANRWVVIGDIV